MKVDSPEGIKKLIEWARQKKKVIPDRYEAMAGAHGVSVAGVRFSRHDPVQVNVAGRNGKS